MGWRGGKCSSLFRESNRRPVDNLWISRHQKSRHRNTTTFVLWRTRITFQLITFVLWRASAPPPPLNANDSHYDNDSHSGFWTQKKPESNSCS